MISPLLKPNYLYDNDGLSFMFYEVQSNVDNLYKPMVIQFPLDTLPSEGKIIITDDSSDSKTMYEFTNDGTFTITETSNVRKVLGNFTIEQVNADVNIYFDYSLETTTIDLTGLIKIKQI